LDKHNWRTAAFAGSSPETSLSISICSSSTHLANTWPGLVSPLSAGGLTCPFARVRAAHIYFGTIT
jgi:hypothetical protein